MNIFFPFYEWQGSILAKSGKFTLQPLLKTALLISSLIFLLGNGNIFETHHRSSGSLTAFLAPAIDSIITEADCEGAGGSISILATGLGDSTFIEVTLTPNCDDIINQDTITVPFTGNPTEVCVPLSLTQAVISDLFLNGGLYIQTLKGCDQDSAIIYSYSLLFGAGFAGPYELDSWDCNGGTFSGQFEDVNELVVLMNAFDPAGGWTINTVTSSIIGGAPGGTYGDMSITHTASGSQSLLKTNFTIISNGTIINIDSVGTHELVVIDPNTGCDDTLLIEMTDFPEKDTILVRTIMNTGTDDICVSGKELPGGVINSLGFCELPENGSVVFVNDSCVTWSPVLDFLGKDTFCLVVCDGGIPEFCDTTIVIVGVEPPIDSIFMTIPIDDPVDTCLTQLIQLPGNIVGGDFCAIDTTEMEAILNGDCVTLDPVDGFLGVTEVCVVHCDDSLPQLCDTTFIFLNIPDPCAGVDIIPIDEITVQSNDDPVEICVPVSLSDAINWTIELDGIPYGEPLSACVPDPPFSEGTAILVPGPGTYSLSVSDLNGCFDSLTIVVEEIIIIPPDTIYLTTKQGVSIDEICFSSDNLSDPIFNVAFCELPSNGTAPVISDSCVMYNPAPVLIGNDRFCVIVCDGNVPPNCDSIYVIVSVTPPIDTVFVDAPNVLPFDTCLTDSDLQLPGNLVSIQSCGFFPNEVEITFNGNCVTMDLANNFVGTTEACVIHCDDSVPQICDTTVLVITNTHPCDDIIEEDNFVLVSDIPGAEICLPIPPEEIDQYAINIDGMPYGGSFIGCDHDSVYVYSFSLVVGQGNAGPYAITWTANGAVFQDTVLNVAELLDSLNAWDPAGNWMPGIIGNTLVSSYDDGDYGQMIWVHLASQITTTVQVSFIGFATGTAVTINGFGEHVLMTQNTTTGCEDILNILIIDETETLDITTLEGVPTDTICLDTTDLSGINAFIICDEPDNGTITAIGLDCFVYTPDPGFTGLDEACVVICDSTGFCDTTYVFITVNPLCSAFEYFGNDTISLMADDCLLPTAYCLPITLDSIFGYSILDNGFVYSGGFQACDNDTCLVYTYFTLPGFGNQGPYFLNSWTINGVGTFTGEFENIEALVDSMNTWDDLGSWDLDTDLLLITNCHTANTYSDIDVNQIATGANAIAELNLQLIPKGSQIELDTGFHELIFIHMATSCEDTLFIRVDCDEDTTGCDILPLSPDIIEVTNCDTLAQFCLDVSIFDIGNFFVADNDEPYAGTFETCSLDPNSVAVLLDTGFHQLVLADTVKGCADTFNILVTCQTIQDIVIDTIIPEGLTEVFCLEDLGFEPALIDSIEITCPDMTTGNVLFEIDQTNWCLELTGLTEGFDTACFKVYFFDTSATVFAYIEVTTPCDEELFDMDNIGTGVLDCAANLGKLCLPVSLVEMQNYSIEVNGVPYPGVLSGCNFDSTFTINCALLPSMGNLGPYILDQWTINGVDTLTGVFDDCEELKDLMNLLDPTGIWERIGDLIVGGNPNSIYGPLEVTQDVTGAQASLGINSSFVPLGTSIILPIGTFDLTFLNTQTGCRDTLIATLACLDSDIFMDTVFVGQKDTLCFETDELVGNFVSIGNACEDASGEFVLFEIISDTCIQYTGIEAGVDSACIILCDDMGVCDTTYVFVAVIEEVFLPPIAVNDTINTGKDVPVTVLIFNNDLNIDIPPFNAFILDPPNHGDVEFLPGGDGVNYVPDEDYCDGLMPDSFTYVICNPLDECDTATVFVTVVCDDVVIYTGFSPNGDGSNDVFKITGLELFDRHKLTIFNRWGNRVFESENYQSDWDGTWDDKDLPDGTYFYVLELEGGNTKSGYVQLHR